MKRKILNVIMAILILPVFTVGVWGVITVFQALSPAGMAYVIIAAVWGLVSLACYCTFDNYF